MAGLADQDFEAFTQKVKEIKATLQQECDFNQYFLRVTP
jgi:hypothetical protein